MEDTIKEQARTTKKQGGIHGQKGRTVGLQGRTAVRGRQEAAVRKKKRERKEGKEGLCVG